MRWGVINKLKHKDNFKFYWFRLTDTAVSNLLADGANKFIDPDLKEQFKVNTFRKNHTIYTYKPVINTKKNGDEVEKKEDIREFCEVLSCSTFYNTKGVGYFDNSFTGQYYIVLDEMNREQSEKNGFDIVYNFVNLMENIARSTKTKIKVILIGNTLEEASDILTAFNFIPDSFGRFKLKNKRAVIDYIKPNENYLKRRKGTIADILLPNASTFTNEVEIDRSLLTSKRKCVKPNQIIKFTKNIGEWFTIWDDGIINDYNGERVKGIAMKRYLDDHFMPELVKMVHERFDVRAYKFTSLSVFKKFQKNLRLLKKQ